MRDFLFRLRAVLMVVVLVLPHTLINIILINPSIASAFSGTGAGTSEDPYLITTCTQLQDIENNSEASYRLANDIDCSGIANFDPIDGFEGVFDGQGHAISNFTINRPTESYIGLFGNISGALVANFSMTNVDVTGDYLVGAVVGSSNGLVYGIEVSGDVTGSTNDIWQSVGGIVGRQGASDITISRLKFSGTVTNTGPNTGGIVGYAGNGNISNSYVDAVITGTTSTGGIVGESNSCCNDITNSYVIGSVEGTDYVGGVIGHINQVGETNVENVFAAASVTATGPNVGAVFAVMNGSYGVDNVVNGLFYDETATVVTDCFTSADITATCTAINGDGLSPTYFYDSDNAPLSSWDFTNVWQEQVGDYPTLRSLGTLSAPGAITGLSFGIGGSNTEAGAEWSAPVNNGGFPIYGYDWEIKKTSNDWEMIFNSDTINDTSFSSLGGLRLGTSYDLRVRAITAYGAGPWTEASYTTPDPEVYEAGTCEELQNLDNLGTPDDIYLLTNDIDCAGIENFEKLFEGDDFAGIFDGQGHTISNLSISAVDSYNTGLFNYISGAEIQNIVFDNTVIDNTGESYFCGVLAGGIEATIISNIIVKNASVSCRGIVGGISGRVESDGRSNVSIVENVMVDGEIHAISYDNGNWISGGYDAGGLFGRASAAYESSTIITRSYSNATVIADESSAGGIVGRAEAEIEEDSEWPTNLIVQDSYSSGSIDAGYNAGGIFGSMESYNDGCEATVEIEVENAYSSATVTAEYSAGGIIGYMDDPNEEGEQYVLNNVFAVGSVTADSLAFALIGSDDGLGDGALIINNSYFDQTTTGQSEASAYDEEIDGWTAINTDGNDGDYFKNNNSNPPLDEWDFDDVWNTTANFPCLQQQLGCGEPSAELQMSSAEDGSAIDFSVANCNGIGDWRTQKETELSKLDPGFNYPQGLIDFHLLNCASGGTATVTIKFTSSLEPSSIVVRKYNSALQTYSTLTPANSGLNVTKTTLENKSAIQIQYQITDGGAFDQDSIINGEIHDPVGIATNVLGTPNTGFGGIKK